MTRRSGFLAYAIGVLSCLPARATAQNQSVWLEQLRPAETHHDGIALSRPFGLSQGAFSAQLTLSYAHNPLSIYIVEQERTLDRITDSWVLHSSFGYGLLPRITIFAGVPLQLAMDGPLSSLAPNPDHFGLGDAWLAARWAIVGDARDMLTLGVQGMVSLPTAQWSQPAGADVATGQHYSGEQTVTVQPRLMAQADLAPWLQITGNLGLRLRMDSTLDLAGLGVGQEVTWGLGATLPLVVRHDHNPLTVFVESYGAIGISMARGQTTPSDLIAGMRVFVTPQISFTAGAGMGLTHGYGSPDYRFFASVSTASLPAEGVLLRDLDDDHIMDVQDPCVNEPEDLDNFQDEDGCPEADNDRDGVLDSFDLAPNTPEDWDGFEDHDGAPDLDDDRDGFPDTRDAAPSEAEDFDRYEDYDGAPERDNDLDGVVDEDDACTNDAGQPSSDPLENGCPPTMRASGGGAYASTLRAVEFRTGRAEFLPQSELALQQIVELLAHNPSLHIRVEGHTDSRGDQQTNLNLSMQRAHAILEWFRAHNVDLSHVEAWGCGEAIPVDSNSTETGRSTNRRVEFRIGGDPPTEVESCARAE